MMICDLPIELQNKIYSYVGVHPCAEIMKKYYKRDFRTFEEFEGKGFLKAIELRRTFRGGDCKSCEKHGRKLYVYHTSTIDDTKILLCKTCIISETTDYYRWFYQSRDYVYPEYKFQEKV